MKIIGLCGTSGSGKSTVGNYFSQKGIVWLDCDRIYHQLVAAPSFCLEEIANHFGSELIQGGVLDRKKLREIVFSSDEKRARLNQITHRHVLSELERQIAALRLKGVAACVIDAPLFFEANLDAWCDSVCAVVADEKTRLIRISKRDGISLDEARIRLNKQTPQQELIRRSDYVIDNSADIKALYNQCDRVINKILS